MLWLTPDEALKNHKNSATWERLLSRRVPALGQASVYQVNFVSQLSVQKWIYAVILWCNEKQSPWVNCRHEQTDSASVCTEMPLFIGILAPPMAASTKEIKCKLGWIYGLVSQLVRHIFLYICLFLSSCWVIGMICSPTHNGTTCYSPGQAAVCPALPVSSHHGHASVNHTWVHTQVSPQQVSGSQQIW